LVKEIILKGIFSFNQVELELWVIR